MVGSGVRQHEATSRDGVQHRGYVDVVIAGSIRRIDLERPADPHQRDAWEAWRAGTWPVPMPG